MVCFPTDCELACAATRAMFADISGGGVELRALHAAGGATPRLRQESSHRPRDGKPAQREGSRRKSEKSMARFMC